MSVRRSTSPDGEKAQLLKWRDGDYCLFRLMTNTMEVDAEPSQYAKSLFVSSTSLAGEEGLSTIKKEVIEGKSALSKLQPGCGVISVVNLSPSQHPAQMYTCLIDLQDLLEPIQRPKCLLCCLSLRSSSLGLFRSQLDAFSENLKTALRALPADMNVIPQGSSADQLLGSWMDTILFVSNIVQLYHLQLPVLIHTAINHSVEVSGDDASTVDQLQQFIKSFSLGELAVSHDTQLIDLSAASSASEPSFGGPSETVKIVVSSKSLQISSSERSDFADRWAQEMLSKGTTAVDPFFLMQVIENLKLQIIQDLNTFKRLLKDAETDFYALYKSYTFLTSSGNSSLLVKCTLSEAKKCQETQMLAVLSAILKFMEMKKTIPPYATPPSKTPLANV